MDAEKQLKARILGDYEADKLVLPSLPDVAIKVREAMRDEKNTARNIAKIIQIDAALTARLIQIANSALYRGNAKIDNLQSAVTRLGIPVTRNLVMSFATRNMFQAKSQKLQALMKSLWSNSSRVAAISYVLAGYTPLLQADKAMLAGLMHSIGILPVIRYAEDFPELIEDEKRIFRIIGSLQGKLGSMILRKWQFDEELVDLPVEAQNWRRDTGNTVDYIDIVVVARVYSQFGSGKKNLPRLEEIPAFSKLSISKLGADAGIEMLRESQNEIAEVMQMLQG